LHILVKCKADITAGMMAPALRTIFPSQDYSAHIRPACEGDGDYVTKFGDDIRRIDRRFWEGKTQWGDRKFFPMTRRQLWEDPYYRSDDADKDLMQMEAQLRTRHPAL
jgi:hypothetical protein